MFLPRPIDRRPALTKPLFRPGNRLAFLHPFQNHTSLKLGHRKKRRNKELAHGRLVEQSYIQDIDFHASINQRTDQMDSLLHIAGKAIQLCHNQNVARFHAAKQTLKLRPLHGCSGKLLHRNRRGSIFSQALLLFLQGISMSLLPLCRYSSITPNRHFTTSF